MAESDQNSNDKVLAAVRLGWLTVEAFGRLRRYSRARGGRLPRADASRRFRFSDRALTRRDELLLAMDQLQHTAAGLVPDLPPTLPHSPDELERVKSDADIDAVHAEFDEWSKQVWVALAVEDERVGRAFSFGGNLADTYWDLDGRGDEELEKALGRNLRAQRLEYIAARFEGIGDALPPYAADVLRHTLYKWRVAEEVKGLGAEKQERVRERLEAQAKVWYDLLFGRRSAESYLTLQDRRRIGWGALAGTAGLVLVVSIVVWLSVLLFVGVGRSLLTEASPWTDQINEASAQLAEQLFTWQNLSALVATLSSVAVVLVGLVSRASGWTVAFHSRAQEWLKLRSLRRRAYRHWGD